MKPNHLKISIKGLAGVGKSTAAYFIKRALEPLGFQCTIKDFDISLYSNEELEKIMRKRERVKAFNNHTVSIKTLDRKIKG